MSSGTPNDQRISVHLCFYVHLDFPSLTLYLTPAPYQGNTLSLTLCNYSLPLFPNCHPKWPHVPVFQQVARTKNTQTYATHCFLLSLISTKYVIIDRTAFKQTSTNLDPKLRFILEAIIKALISKSSRSSIMITLNRVHSNHDSHPDSNLSDYLNFHTCLHKYLLM